MNEDVAAREIAREQEFVDTVYRQLAESTRSAEQLAAEGRARGQLGHEGGLVERDAMVYQAARRMATLDAAHEGLVFGRLDLRPERDPAPHWESYDVPADPMDRALDLLSHIKWHLDGSLTFRKSCAHGICGSDAMKINGENKLACSILVQDLVGKNGGTISGPIKEGEIFPSMVGHMVGVGEETGGLDTMLSKIADFYEDQVEASVKSLTSILEPIMIIVVGAIVGFIVVAMYMPLFKIYDEIG